MSPLKKYSTIFRVIQPDVERVRGELALTSKFLYRLSEYGQTVQMEY